MAGCTNSHYTASTTNPNLKHFRIPKKHRQYYDAFFKTDKVSWNYARICSEHWSKPRENSNHLPDIRVPSNNLPVRRRLTPYQRADKNHKTLKKVQKGVSSAQAKVIEKDRKIEQLQKELFQLKENSQQLISNNAELQRKLESVSLSLEETEKKVKEAETTIRALKEKTGTTKEFSWKDVDASTFRYLTGLEICDFTTLFDIFAPFLHLLKYEGCKQSYSIQRKLSKDNELFCVLVILRHGVEEGILSWITDVSQSTMSRIFVAWMAFGSAVFSKISLSHPKELILEKLPQSFKDLRQENVVLVLDATEFKLTSLSDLNLNCLFFSDYKNTHTAKGLIGITPYGSLCRLPDLYPGSVTDSKLTIETGVLDGIKPNDCILVDKGFAIAEQAAERGGVVNRPPMADVDQFTSGEVEANFKIAALRIHVERWIGRCRNFTILNKVWHTSRLDLLNETFKFVAHLVNLLDVVGPKE